MQDLLFTPSLLAPPDRIGFSCLNYCPDRQLKLQSQSELRFHFCLISCAYLSTFITSLSDVLKDSRNISSKYTALNIEL